MSRALCAILLIHFIAVPTVAATDFLGASWYAWLDPKSTVHPIAERFDPPRGFTRPATQPSSYASWLRGLPLKKGSPSVMLFNGKAKANQDAHAAVLDIDVGSRDLQQCADAIIRLRAEYLRVRAQSNEIVFSYTSGDRIPWNRWQKGERPRVVDNRVTWSREATPDSSYRAFRAYLDSIFTYAGTLSLNRELRSVRPTDPIESGDVFIRGGSPGHAAVVVDVAVNPSNGRRVFMLVQSFMPAQELHVLRNPNDPVLSPWYEADRGRTLKTPEWEFQWDERKRFP